MHIINKPMLRSGLITVNEEPFHLHFQSDAQQLPLESHGFLQQQKPCACVSRLDSSGTFLVISMNFWCTHRSGDK